MEIEKSGYDSSLFTSTVDEQFECIICSNVVRDPKECNGCGTLFCGSCIDDWLLKKKECPKRCNMSNHQIIPVSSKALLRIYNNLDIKCQMANCGKNLKLSDYDSHLQECNLKNCLNFDVCKKKENSNVINKQFCSIECELHYKIIQEPNKSEQHKIISAFIQQYLNNPQQSNMKIIKPLPNNQINQQINIIAQPSNIQKASVISWDPNASGTGIKLSENNTKCWLQESSYMFRTILGNIAFTEGVHYWEIHADEKTENELKIGVANRRDFNYNSAFCDFDFGFAFYGLGQLRHGSNASGPQFGQRFKKEGYLGIFLNMNKGQLSFALNGNYLGVGFTHESLKKGPIYPAVSLLHQAGCKIVSGKPIPNYFQ